MGGLDPPPPLKNRKNIEFLNNTAPDPLKITKLPSKHSMLGHHWHASEMPIKWRFAGGPIKAHLFVKVGPPLTQLFGSAHETCSS